MPKEANPDSRLHRMREAETICHQYLGETMSTRGVAIYEIRRCPICEAFLESHPSLRGYRVTEQQRRKGGNYTHVTPRGRMLHRSALKGKQ